jgi:glycosyltransferase involved in cell wall biosynthesis
MTTIAPRHVAILMLAPFVSGAEQQTLALCRYLQARCRVTLLVNDELGSLLRTDPFLREYTAPLSVQTLGSAFPLEPARTAGGALRRAALYPRLQARLVRTLLRLRPDLVHLMLAPSFFAYLPLFRTLHLPTVMTLAGEMRYVRHFYGMGKRLAVRAAVRLADGLVICSADEAANLSAVEPAQAARAVVLDNFTDVSRWNPLEKDPNRVTFAARLHPEKAPLLFVEAAALIARTHPSARFALYGKGELESEVDDRIVALELEGHIERSFVTDLSSAFGVSSVFVSCQRHENLGSSSLLEAMASGNAIVATDVGQTRQIVDETVGALVTPSADALADGIRSLLDDPAGVARKGRAARDRVLDRYGPDRYVDGLLSVYKGVLGFRREHAS